MKIHFAGLSILITLLFAGCSTGVVPAGPDTYFISKPVSSAGSTGAAKAAIYREANAWCQKRGLIMVPITTDAKDFQLYSHLGNAELTFRALKPGDPDIKRVDVESPTTTKRIELR